MKDLLHNQKSLKRTAEQNEWTNEQTSIIRIYFNKWTKSRTWRRKEGRTAEQNKTLSSCCLSAPARKEGNRHHLIGDSTMNSLFRTGAHAGGNCCLGFVFCFQTTGGFVYLNRQHFVLALIGPKRKTQRRQDARWGVRPDEQDILIPVTNLSATVPFVFEH